MVTADNRIDRYWRGLIDIGPRFQGTEGADTAAALIAAELRSLGLSPVLEAFGYPGWTPGTGSRLTLVGSPDRAIPSYPMLWSAGTTQELSGRLESLGLQTVWGGMYSWRKFAILAGEKVVAYVCGRPDGVAIPEPIAPSSDPEVAHVVIGREDLAVLEGLLQGGATVEARVEVGARETGPATGLNVRCRLGEGPVQLVVCAHYDTVWSTVGAYDNASGVAAVLELAARLSQEAPPSAVELVLFGGEEWHLAGSKSYVAAHGPELRGIRAALCFDGIGRGDECEVWIGPERFEWVVMHAVRRFQSSRKDRQVRFLSKCPPPPGSDHASFFEAGLPAAEITFNDLELLHRPEDVPNESSRRNIDYMADLATFLVRELGGDPSWMG